VPFAARRLSILPKEGGLMDIQQPIGGPDVTRRNKRDVLYIQGDGLASTPNAERILKEPGKPVTPQTGINGRFNKTSWKWANGSVIIGESFRIGGAGGNIRTRDDAEPDANRFSFLPAIDFNPDGSAFLQVPFLDKMINADIFPGPTTAQLTALTIGLVVPAGTRRLLETITFEAGSIAATSPVLFSIFVGTDNTGQLIDEQNLDQALFAADLPIVIPITSTVVLEANTQYFIEMVSSVVFSVDLNTLGQVITNFEFHNSRLEGVVTENRMVNKNLLPMVNKNLKPIYSKQF